MTPVQQDLVFATVWVRLRGLVVVVVCLGSFSWGPGNNVPPVFLDGLFLIPLRFVYLGVFFVYSCYFAEQLASSALAPTPTTVQQHQRTFGVSNFTHSFLIVRIVVTSVLGD